MGEKHPRPVAHGQRIIHEVVFEPDPVLKARVRFVHKPGEALPPGAVEAFNVIDVAELTASPSAWEALEDDDLDGEDEPPSP
ncbi:hypothetical protein ACO2Q3_03200 [Caulobacter sp. KR2-114]|uniref:hypothetical protein n=1 Tax=Caulobacter sp. KR2-114 TaxID=3400912 RepID=UPI003C017695